MMASEPADLSTRFPEATDSRLEHVHAALMEMQADAAELSEVPLTFLEPLCIPGLAERWIEGGGSLD